MSKFITVDTYILYTAPGLNKGWDVNTTNFLQNRL